jgi:hypothetical protein
MDVLDTLRVSILMTFRALPVLLISFVAFLAIGLGNMGMFVLSLGQIVVVPIVTEILQFITGTMYTTGDSSVYVQGSDIVQLVSSMSNRQQVNVTPSYWMQHILFFFGYLVANGVGLYRLPQETGVSDIYYENRRAKARGVIIVSVLAAVAFSYFRYQTGAETWRGIALSVLSGGGVGFAWYQFAAYCGARHADVFGVAPSLIPVSAKDEKAMTCVYSPRQT